MFRIITCTCLGLASLAWSGSAHADPAAEVRCAEISFSLSVERRDIEAFRAHLDADARFVGSSVHRGPEAIVAAWSVLFTDDGPRLAWRPLIVEVLDSGDYALSRGPYRLETRGEDGAPVVSWGTFNSVWRRNADGRWRVVLDAGSEAAEAPPPEVRSLLDEGDSGCPAARE